MEAGQALAIGVVVLCSVLALNCVYGIYLSSGPLGAPSTRTQRLFMTFFGLQRLAAQTLSEYARQGQRQETKTLLGTTFGGLALTLLLAEITLSERWLTTEVGLLVFGLYLVALGSFLPAILLEERIFPSGR